MKDCQDHTSELNKALDEFAAQCKANNLPTKEEIKQIKDFCGIDLTALTERASQEIDQQLEKLKKQIKCK